MSKFIFKAKKVDASGEPIKQIAPIKGPSTAMSAVLNIIANHTAEVFHAVVDAISEKYKIDKDEMMGVIINHPAYTAITTNPVLNDIETLTEEPVPEPVTVPVSPKFKIKKKAVTTG
jgi:hypothetical protein